MAVELHLHDIRKTFVKDGASFNAVERVELDVKGGELVTFLGPSGCGKTTTLRMVAASRRRPRDASSSTGRT